MKECQMKKNLVWQGAGNNQVVFLVSPWSWLFNLKSLFYHLISLIKEQTVVMLLENQNGKSWVIKGHLFTEQSVLDSHVPQFCRFCCCLNVTFAWMSPGHLPETQMWASILMKVVSEGKRITVKRSFTCCLFFIGIPEDFRKSLFFLP